MKRLEEVRNGFIVVFKKGTRRINLNQTIKSILKNKYVDYIQATIVLKQNEKNK